MSARSYNEPMSPCARRCVPRVPKPPPDLGRLRRIRPTDKSIAKLLAINLALGAGDQDRRLFWEDHPCPML
jgi:hypothetical protein